MDLLYLFLLTSIHVFLQQVPLCALLINLLLTALWILVCLQSARTTQMLFVLLITVEGAMPDSLLGKQKSLRHVVSSLQARLYKCKIYIFCFSMHYIAAVTVCKYNGNIYQVGDSFSADDGCNKWQINYVLLNLLNRGFFAALAVLVEQLHVQRNFAVSVQFYFFSIFFTVLYYDLLLCIVNFCVKDGVKYNVGDTFPAGDGCNKWYVRNSSNILLS